MFAADHYKSKELVMIWYESKELTIVSLQVSDQQSTHTHWQAFCFMHKPCQVHLMWQVWVIETVSLGQWDHSINGPKIDPSMLQFALHDMSKHLQVGKWLARVQLVYFLSAIHGVYTHSYAAILNKAANCTILENPCNSFERATDDTNEAKSGSSQTLSDASYQIQAFAMGRLICARVDDKITVCATNSSAPPICTL